MLNAAKKMNAHQNKIPITGFREVKFEPPVLRSKTSLKPATRQLERNLADITRRDLFAGEVGIPRRGSEGVSSLGPRVQSFRPRPLRSPKNSAKRPVGEFEMEPGK
jgi:hypothetical protein